MHAAISGTYSHEMWAVAPFQRAQEFWERRWRPYWLLVGAASRGLSPGASCIFNQAISPSLLSNFWPGSGQAEGKRGVSNYTHKHINTNTHKHTHTNTHTQLYTCTPLTQRSRSPVVTGYRALPGPSLPRVFLVQFAMAVVPWDVPVLVCVSNGCCPSGAPVSPWHTVSSPGYIFIPGRWGLSLTQLFRICLCFSSQQSWIRVGALSGLLLSLPGWLHTVPWVSSLLTHPVLL